MKTSACIQDPASTDCWQHIVQTSPKQQARQKHKPNRQQMGFSRTPQNTRLTEPCPSEGKKKKNLPLPSGTHAQVPPDIKPTQVTEPNLPTKRREQKQEGLQP